MFRLQLRMQHLLQRQYIGDDIESVVSKLLAAADNDVEKAEQGIILLMRSTRSQRRKTPVSVM